MKKAKSSGKPKLLRGSTQRGFEDVPPGEIPGSEQQSPQVVLEFVGGLGEVLGSEGEEPLRGHLHPLICTSMCLA